MQLNFATLRHLDFSVLWTADEYPNLICACARCKVLYRILSKEQNAYLSDLYRSEAYSEHHEDHMVRDEVGMLHHTCDIQARILFENMARQVREPSVLISDASTENY